MRILLTESQKSKLICSQFVSGVPVDAMMVKQSETNFIVVAEHELTLKLVSGDKLCQYKIMLNS